MCDTAILFHLDFSAISCSTEFETGMSILSGEAVLLGTVTFMFLYRVAIEEYKGEMDRQIILAALSNHGHFLLGKDGILGAAGPTSEQ